MQLRVRHDQEPRLVREQAGLLERREQVLVQPPQRTAPQRVRPRRAAPLERPARELDEAGQVVATGA